MTIAEFNTFCGSLPHTTHVVQWGGAHVWKVGGKVFALARRDADDAELFVTFKVSELGYEILKEQPGLRPAPYLASRGLKWIQRTSTASMKDKALRDALGDAHALIAAGLPKKTRCALGLDEARGAVPARPRSKTGGKR